MDPHMDQTGKDSDADPETEALEELVGEALAALESGGARAVDDLLRDHPRRADAVRRRLVRLEQLGLLDSGDASDVPERVGEFAIEDVLAEGGMGVVYRRAVALKVVRPELLLVPGARARIRREAEAAAQLNHPNIAVLHRYGEQDGLPFLAMELVEGRSLAQVLDAVGGPEAPEPNGRQLIPNGPASWTAACLQICAEVARALDHAHERGVLHRDVKPSNVLVDEAGHARLVDFGLARMEGGGQLTRTGSQVGSLYYMAPEQLLERSANLDGRVDVYALGVTLYELLTRTSPFAGHPPEETIRRIREGHFERPRRIAPHLSRDVEAVLLQAMSLDRERRYENAAAFAEELDNLLALRPVVARRPTTAARVRGWMRRRPRLATALVLLLVVSFAGWGLVEWLQGANRRALAEESTRTSAQTAALGELLTELGLMLDEAMLSQDDARMQRIASRLEAVEDYAVELPESGKGNPLAVANGRLTLAINSISQSDLERSIEHINVARAALDELGDDAPLPLVFRAHVILCDLSRQIDDAAQRRMSWEVAQKAFEELEASGIATAEDRLLLLHGAVDEANLARAAGDYGLAFDLLGQASALYRDEPDSRAERLAIGRIWVEQGRLSMGLYDYAQARIAADRAAELLDGVEADTPTMRSTLAGWARLEADLLAVAGDVQAGLVCLEEASAYLSSPPVSLIDFDIALRTLDLRMRFAEIEGDREALGEMILELRGLAFAALEQHGMFEQIRGASLQILSNLVGACMTTERFELGRQIGAEGLSAWRALAAPGESSLVHAQMLINRGALEQWVDDEQLAAEYFAAADEVLEADRRAGRDDDALDRTQLVILYNRGIIAWHQGHSEEAEELLTRARAISRPIAERSGSSRDWLRHAEIGQELANVHMDTELNAHSITVLEESIADLDALELDVGLTAELAFERDGQCFSLMTQYLQNGAEDQTHELLRTVLGRDSVDPELDAQFVLAAAYAIRPEHPEVEADRALCRAWIERANAGDASFAEQVDPRYEPWDRLSDGD
ncbi:MAG: serine/threonine-protein kinase [Planctomycetota bacterium]|jgi:tetratricopeptide (TPR) repeat protein